MNPLWLLTAGVLVIGGAVILAFLRGTAEAAKLLSDELASGLVVPRDAAADDRLRLDGPGCA